MEICRDAENRHIVRPTLGCFPCVDDTLCGVFNHVGVKVLDFANRRFTHLYFSMGTKRPTRFQPLKRSCLPVNVCGAKHVGQRIPNVSTIRRPAIHHECRSRDVDTRTYREVGYLITRAPSAACAPYTRYACPSKQLRSIFSVSQLPQKYLHVLKLINSGCAAYTCVTNL